MPEGFVGREPELRALTARLAAAQAGRGGLVFLVGESGVGKTRTAEELVARAGLPADRVLWGRCAEHEGAPAYWPWVQALRAWAESVDDETMRADLGPGGPDLARLLPAGHERGLDLPPAEALEPAQARFRVLDGMSAWLRRTAARAPVLVVLDDLHWADHDSLVLLDFVAREVRTARVLLVGTYREAEMRRREGHLAELAGAGERIAIRGLDRAGVEAFVRVTSRVTASPAVVDRLLGATDGNPFFLRELLRVLPPEGLLGSADLGSVLLELPEVGDAVRRHLLPLSAEDRELLTIAAVLGREFDLRSWQRVCDAPPDRLLERLGVAAEAGLVVPVPESLGRFRFAHALIRERLCADVGPANRATLHRRVALALEALYAFAADPPYAELAHHFFQAAPLGEGPKAVEYALRAGERATALGAPEDTVEHYTQALAALSFTSPDAALERRVLLALGDAQWGAGDFGGARRTFERAARAARSRRDAEGLALAAVALSRVSPEVGAFNATLSSFLDEALRLLPEGDGVLRAMVMARLARTLYFSGETARLEAMSAEAVAMARRLDDRRTLLAALVTRHVVLWGPDTPLEERLALAHEIDERSGSKIDEFALEGHAWRVLDLFELGDMSAADREIDRYFSRCETGRLPARWHPLVVRATRATMIGRLERGLALAAEALTLRQEGLLSLPALFYAAQLFLPFREVGRLDELEEPYASFARAFPPVPFWRIMVALVQAEGGREAGARAWLDLLAARDFADLPRDGNYLPSLCQLAELVTLLDDGPRARRLAPLLAPFADRHVIVALCAVSLGAAARYCGLLAETSGDLNAAVGHFERAIALNSSLGARIWLARSQLDCARALLARGADDAERAGRLLDEAASNAAELGMPHLAGQVAAVRASVSPSASGPSPEPTPGVSSPTAELRREGDYWTVVHGGTAFRLRDTKGLGYLAMLLGHPGREFHALDLVGGGPDPDASVGAAHVREAGLSIDAGDAGELVDAQARSAYRRRLETLRDELEEARAFNDRFRAERLQEEMEALAAELARGMGLGGRARRAGSHAERARLNVTRAIAAVVKRIAAQDAPLGRYLEATVRTGLFCSYTPLPGAPDWT